jgi:hypothetical protein
MIDQLRNANKLLRGGLYSDALAIYNQLKNKSQFYSSLVSFNIEVCEGALNREVNSQTSQLDYYKFLNIEIGKKTYKLDYKDYNNISESIIRNQANTDTLISICTAICISPFQVDLHKLLLNFISLDDIKVNYLINEVNSLTYLDILIMCNSSTGWLAGRKKLKKYLESNNYDYRADHLLSNDPSGDLDIKKDYFKNSKLDFQRNDIAFGTILLNEQRYIFDNLIQHYEFCDQWILVEGACLGYPERKVSKGGLSLDKTADLIKCFPDPRGKIIYIQYGWTKKSGEDAKSELRNKYLELSNSGTLVVIDADEFYTKEDLIKGVNQLKDKEIYAVTLPQVHYWKNIGKFITGAYYDISHTRIYRNLRGMKYIRNHNFPELSGKFLTEMGHFKFKRTLETMTNGKVTYKEPKCHHMGFAKDEDDMKDKSEYYVNRGEMQTRSLTTQSRAAWFDDNLPDKCQVREWGGEIPQSLIIKK